MATFKPGESGNPKGRPPGTPNKCTMVIRETLEVALCKELETIPALLRQLEPRERIEAISRLLPYVSPKLQAAYLETEGDIVKPPSIHVHFTKRAGEE